MIGYIIISNNCAVKEKYDETHYVEGSTKDIFTKARDMIHRGHELISHPLPASIKIMSSPFRSIVLTKKRQEAIDPLQIEVIENSIIKLERHLKLNGIDSKHRSDYKKFDLWLLESALQESDSLHC